ncbi:MAG: tetratricopeptide repeat protein [Candidatus Staskawiczbacteria bacterium]|nr:tetratricopeptide repeat protein [Candidatus Staskawiczbacteria bacterium]
MPKKNFRNEENSITARISQQEFPISKIQAHFLIWLIGFVLYFKSIFFGFTYLDDNALILDNIDFLSNIGNIFSVFARDVFYATHGLSAYYRPLLTVSLMFDAVISGQSPAMYHFTNIIIHLAGSSLVFTALLKLKYSRIASFFLAVIFSVHPALTQAVAWIPGRNDSLLAVFVLASFIFFLDFIEKGKNRSVFWSAFFFLLAIFTKETALLLPAVFLFYAFLRYFPLKNILFKFSIPWIVSVVVFFLLRHIAFENPLQARFKDIFLSVFFNLPALIQLLGKVFFPFNLSVLPIIQDTTFIFGAMGIFFILILVIMKARDKSSPAGSFKMMLFGIAWFIVFLLPSFIRPNAFVTADFIEHRLYLPFFGIIIFLAESRLPKFLEDSFGGWHFFGWIVLASIFFVVSFLHQNNFYNRTAFWKNAALNSPHSPLAQRNLGAMYYLDGQYDLAEEYYKKSLTINKTEPMVHNNLGLIYVSRGLFLEAEKEYLEELSLNPNYDNARFNLGLLYYKAGKIEEAKKEWEKTLEINPEHSDAIKLMDFLNKGR